MSEQIEQEQAEEPKKWAGQEYGLAEGFLEMSLNTAKGTRILYVKDDIKAIASALHYNVFRLHMPQNSIHEYRIYTNTFLRFLTFYSHKQKQFISLAGFDRIPKDFEGANADTSSPSDKIGAFFLSGRTKELPIEGTYRQLVKPEGQKVEIGVWLT